MRQFHHMGASKNSASLSRKDIDIHEILIKISIQVVWIALARKSYSKIGELIDELFVEKLHK